MTVATLADILGNLSKDVFERRTLTGREAFFLFICLDAIKFSLLTFSSLLKTIYPRVLTKPLPNDAKSPLPVDVRRSKTLLNKNTYADNDNKREKLNALVSLVTYKRSSSSRGTSWARLSLGTL